MKNSEKNVCLYKHFQECPIVLIFFSQQSSSLLYLFRALNIFIKWCWNDAKKRKQKTPSPVLQFFKSHPYLYLLSNMEMVKANWIHGGPLPFLTPTLGSSSFAITVTFNFPVLTFWVCYDPGHFCCWGCTQARMGSNVALTVRMSVLSSGLPPTLFLAGGCRVGPQEGDALLDAPAWVIEHLFTQRQLTLIPSCLSSI